MSVYVVAAQNGVVVLGSDSRVWDELTDRPLGDTRKILQIGRGCFMMAAGLGGVAERIASGLADASDDLRLLATDVERGAESELREFVSSRFRFSGRAEFLERLVAAEEPLLILILVGQLDGLPGYARLMFMASDFMTPETSAPRRLFVSSARNVAYVSCMPGVVALALISDPRTWQGGLADGVKKILAAEIERSRFSGGPQQLVVLDGSSGRWLVEQDNVFAGNSSLVTQKAIKTYVDAHSSGALVLLEQHTASSSASLDFTSWYSSSYDEYVIELVKVLPATNSSILGLRFSTDGGSSYDASAIWDRVYQQAYVNGHNEGGLAGETAFYFSGAASNDATYAGVRGCVRIYDPAAAVYCMCEAQGTCKAADVNAFMRGLYAGVYKSASGGINAFRILFSSGNIASGVIRVYGIAK